MDNERTVVMTEREQQVGETEHPTSGCLDTGRQANFKGSRVGEEVELELALRLHGSRSERSDAPARPLQDTARVALEFRTARTFSDLEWARAALDSGAGRRLTDAEWVGARARLLEFMGILRTWNQQAKTSESEAGSVVVIAKPIAEIDEVQELPCQREL